MSTPRSIDDMALGLSQFGSRGNAKLKVLNSLIKYLEPIAGTDIGQVILNDDMTRCMALMEKGYAHDLDDDERAELKYLKRRLDKIANRLHMFKELQSEIMNKARGNGHQ